MENMTPQEGDTDKEVLENFPVKLPEGLTPEFVVNSSIKMNQAHEGAWVREYARIREYMRLSRSQSTDNASKSVVTVPLAENIKSTMSARMMRTTFPSGKVGDALLDAADIEDATEEIGKVEHFINQSFTESPNVKLQANDFFDWAITGGTGVKQVHWDQRTAKTLEPQFELDLETQELLPIGEKEVMKKIGFPNCTSRSIFDMAWEPTFRNGFFEDCPWIRVRHKYSWNRLLEEQSKGFFQNVEKMVDMVGSGNSGDDDNQKKIIESILNDPQDVNSNKQHFNVDEFWATIVYRDAEGKMHRDESRFFVLEGRLLIKYGKNPFNINGRMKKPFIWFRYAPRLDGGSGSSAFEPVQSMIRNINTNKGKEADLIRRSANTPFLYGAGAGINTRNLWMAPNGGIQVDDPTQVTTMPIPAGAINATASSIANDMAVVRQSTPANEQAQGIGGGGGTATESRILQLGSGAKFEHLASRIGTEYTAPMLQWYFWLYQKFGKDGQMFYRDGSRDGIPKAITRRDLARDYRFVHVGPASEADRSLKISQLDKVIANLISVATATQDPEMFKSIVALMREQSALLGITNAQEIFPENVGQAAAENAEQGLVGGTGGAVAGNPAGITQ